MSQTDTPPSRLRVLIVDDEAASRRLLRRLLEYEAGIEIVGACRHGEEAITVLGACAVDLVFLDIEMPGKDGFEVVRALRDPPAIVFVTAYDQFALEAFAVEAWDYLLKPFDEVRLGETLRRVRARFTRERSAVAPAPDELRIHGDESGDGAPVSVTEPPLERLAIPQGRGRVTVQMADVLAVEAESNYARFHLTADSHLARIALATLEKRLDPGRFVRVHRSWIVNVDHLARQEPAGHGDLVLTMANGRPVPLSRRYRQRLEALLEPLS